MPPNGWTPIAKKVGIWGGAITVSAVIAGWLHTKLIVEPSTLAAQTKVVEVVSDAVRQEGVAIRTLIAGEGAIRDNADSVQWAAFERLREEVRAGVYSRAEIDQMRANSYRRQDSLYRAAVREARRP